MRLQLGGSIVALAVLSLGPRTAQAADQKKDVTAATPAVVAVSGDNAGAIADFLSSEPSFSFTAAGKNQIVVSCKATCTQSDLDRIRTVIKALSSENFLVLSTSGSAANAAEKVNLSYPGIRASVLPGANGIRLTSSTPIPDATVSEIKKLIQSPPAILVVDLPSFCLSGSLEAAPAAALSGCQGEATVPGANAGEIVEALSTDPNFTIKALSDHSVQAACKVQLCTQFDIDRVSSSIRSLARPKPAYSQDFEVPAGTAADIAGRSGLKALGITAEAIGSEKIRLKSDTPVSEKDVTAIIRQYLFGNPAPPAFRMFYQDPKAVVPTLGSAPGSTASAPAAAPAASPKAASPSDTSSTKSGATAKTAKSDTTAPAPASTSSAAAAPAKQEQSPAAQTPEPVAIGKDMTAVNDNVVFTDAGNEAAVWQRIRLLTLLDLPRPEVLMNVWSYQASSPSGTEILHSAEKVRDLVNAHNDALENSIQYGWSYLSRQMKNDALHRTEIASTALLELQAATAAKQPQHQLFSSQAAQSLDAGETAFFDHDFYDYITQKFVGDPEGRLDKQDRILWGFCPAGKFCLGYAQAFQPVRPNLTSILMGAVASRSPLKTMLTTIGCMEGKYEVYGDTCFKGREKFNAAIREAEGTSPLKNKRRQTESLDYAAEVASDRECLRSKRRDLLENDKRFKDRISCEVLDGVALQAQESCGVAQTLPLSCFTIEAAQTFASPTTVSTFTLRELNELAEENLVERLRPAIEADKESDYGATRVGLLRAAIADFLFNYKMSQEFPKDFIPYDLQHSAQELNAELNPLVVAFNQDVAAFSRHVSDQLENGSGSQTSFLQLWRNRNSFLNDGIITVRGIGGFESTVDTATQNYFDATHAQSLSEILTNLSGQGSSGSSVLSSLEAGTLNPATEIAALAAITPPSTKAQIGRQLTLDVTPHTLPGASSAELAVTLTAAESADPALYQGGKATGATDNLSRVAKHNVTTRVRVESVKMFELSSFSALLQRPRNKFPLVPPFVEMPLIGSFASLPLPGAKEYHRSTAIISAVIVPTAADLAYGIDFAHDRLIVGEEATAWGRSYKMRSVISLGQFRNMPIRAFHKAMVTCFATNTSLIFPGGVRSLAAPNDQNQRCSGLDFSSVPPEF